MSLIRRERAQVARVGLAAVVVIVLICVCWCASAVAAGDVNVAACGLAEGSPGFRVFLPDCRAYELVTPSYDGDGPVLGPRESSPMSPDGEHVIGISLAGFCGTENLEEIEESYGAFYEFSRTAAGWSCEALDPPASEYPRRKFEFASADLSRSLWNLQVPVSSGEEAAIVEGFYDGWTLAVREAAGGGKGRFALLGPVVAPGHELNVDSEGDNELAYAVVGASADLTDVLLSVTAEHKQLWPGDATVEGDRQFKREAISSSLYEYGGGGGEPVLVGVRNSGVLDGVPSVNDGAELISQCGTGADGISASGEVVFFTANAADQGPGGDHCNAAGEGTGPAVNELYARVGGSRTIAISEPSTGPGGDCEGCDESVPMAASFQAASEGGERVFFTTEQDLLPGAAGDSLYEYDFNAAAARRVRLVAANVTSVATAAQGGERVYFGSGAVLAAAANGRGEVVNGDGEPAEVGHANLYVFDSETGDTAFVAQEAGQEQTTRDGRFLLFSSSRDLVGTGDTSPVGQLFEYDAETGAVVRVSVGQRSGAGYECPGTKTFEEGFDCDGNTEDGEDQPKMTSRLGVAGPSASSSSLSLAEDGTVAFSSELTLTPQAVQGQPSPTGGQTENVYEYRAGDVYLISAADEASPLAGRQRLLGIGESGRDVFFATTDSLVPQDTDTQYSWYDAREEGGFPGPASVQSCVGEACQGPVATPPSFAAPESGTVAASGNLAPVVPVKPVVKPKARPKCRKGFVRKKGKCVRKRKAGSKKPGRGGK